MKAKSQNAEQSTEDASINLYCDREFKAVEKYLRSLPGEKLLSLSQDQAIEQGLVEFLQKQALYHISLEPAGPWDDAIYDIFRLSEGSEKFFRSVAETIRRTSKSTKRRKGGPSVAESLILHDWDSVEFGKKFPGLKFWHLEAIAEFMNFSLGENRTARAWKEVIRRLNLQRKSITIQKLEIHRDPDGSGIKEIVLIEKKTQKRYSLCGDELCRALLQHVAVCKNIEPQTTPRRTVTPDRLQK